MQDLSTKQHFVGCDVSKDTLDLALYQPKTDYRKFEHVQISNDTEGFKQLLQWLKARKIKKNEVAIAFEHTGAYSIALAEWLHKKKITFNMLHPLDVKNACSRGRNKTDEVDAKFIADYAYTMREKLAPSGPEPKNIKHLRELRNERDLCVRCRASYLCQIKVQTEAQTIARMHKMVDFMTVQIHQIEEEIKKINRRRRDHRDQLPSPHLHPRHRHGECRQHNRRHGKLHTLPNLPTICQILLRQSDGSTVGHLGTLRQPCLQERSQRVESYPFRGSPQCHHPRSATQTLLSAQAQSRQKPRVCDECRQVQTHLPHVRRDKASATLCQHRMLSWLSRRRYTCTSFDRFRNRDWSLDKSISSQ